MTTSKWYPILRGFRLSLIITALWMAVEVYLGYSEPIPVVKVYWWLLLLIWVQLLSITLCLKNLLMAYLAKARLEIQNYD